eukprot:UN29807
MNALHDDYCSAKCMTGYEGPEVQFKCYSGKWVATSPEAESFCKPSWNQYVDECEALSKSAAQTSNECLNQCELDKKCQAFRFNEVSGCTMFSTCENGIRGTWAGDQTIYANPACETNSDCPLDKVCVLVGDTTSCVNCTHFSSETCPTSRCKRYVGNCVKCVHDSDCDDHRIQTAGQCIDGNCVARCNSSPVVDSTHFDSSKTQSSWCTDKITGQSCDIKCQEHKQPQSTSTDMRAFCMDTGEWHRPPPCVDPPQADQTDGVYPAYNYVGCFTEDPENRDLKYGPHQGGYVPFLCS